MIAFISEVSEQELKRQKEKARELRKSRWWQNRLAQGVCHYCGQKIGAAELTMDHLVPLVRGGTSSRGNVVPACKECNNRKKYLLPLEWEEYLHRLAASDPSEGIRPVSDVEGRCRSEVDGEDEP